MHDAEVKSATESIFHFALALDGLLCAPRKREKQFSRFRRKCSNPEALTLFSKDALKPVCPICMYLLRTIWNTQVVQRNGQKA